jgi:hypothetical protein
MIRIRGQKKIRIGKPGVRAGSLVARQRARKDVVEISASSPDPRVHAVPTDLDPHLREELARAVAGQILTGRLIAVIVPVLSRPGRVASLLASFRACTSEADAAIYFVAQTSDTAEVEAIRAAGLDPLLVGDEDRPWCRKINRGYERTTEPWLLLAADDVAFRPGWVDLIRPLLQSHAGVIGTNDLGNRSTMIGIHSTHPLVRRAYADICGTVDERRKVVHGAYAHNFPDTELVATARRRGLYVHRADLVIEHLHPSWGKGQTDAVYALGASSFARDQALFRQRSLRFRL